MKRLLTLIALAAALVLPSALSAQSTPAVNGCYQTTVSATGYTLVFTNNGGMFVRIQAAYYTTGSPGSVTTQLYGGYVPQATSNPFALGSTATNTTSAEIGVQSASYKYWYVRTTALSGGATLIVTTCISNNVTAQSLLSTLGVTQGGTGLASGTSGGVPYFNSSTTMASSAALAANGVVLGGGAGAAPSTISTITTDGASILTLGTTSGGAVGKLLLGNATSGTVGLTPTTGALGTVLATFPAASITVSGIAAQVCGTTSTCSATAASTNLKIATGSVALGSASPSVVTVTGISPAFTSTSTYFCSATPEGATAAIATGGVALTKVSGSSITLTGPNTVTTVIDYVCMGT